MIDIRLEHETTLQLESGVLVVTDYPENQSLLVSPPALPRKFGENASVFGAYVAEGVLIDTAVSARSLPVFAVHDGFGDLYGFLVWLESTEPGAEFLDEPEQLQFVDAGGFGVDSGSFRMVDQAELQRLPDDSIARVHAVSAFPRFPTGGDGWYGVYTVFRGETLAAVYAAVAFESEFPPLRNIRRSSLSDDPGTLEEFRALEILPPHDLSSMNLAGKQFDRCRIASVLFDGADLSETRFENCLIHGASFRGSNLSCAHFEHSELHEASFAQAQFSASLSDCLVHDCDFSEATELPQFSGFNAVFGSNFGEIDVDGFTFEGLLIDSNLRGAQLASAKFNGVDLKGTDLSNSNLDKSKLSNATLELTDLSNASLREASLRGVKGAGVNLSGANLELAQLVGADLRGADLSGANLTNAILRDADLTGANLDGAVMRKTKLQGATMPDGAIHD